MNLDILDKIEKGLTPTERRIYNVLRTGEAYSANELISKVWGDDPAVEKATLNDHLISLRNKLRIADLDILLQYKGKVQPARYRMIILITALT